METIFLQRIGEDQPWGFRLTGGPERQQLISVHKVTLGSIAASKLSKDDVILRIEDTPVSHLSLHEAQNIIHKCGNKIKLTVRRQGFDTLKKIGPPAQKVIGYDSGSITSESDLTSSLKSADSQDSVHSPTSRMPLAAHSYDSGFDDFALTEMSEHSNVPAPPPLPSTLKLSSLKQQKPEAALNSPTRQFIPDALETMMMKPGDKKPFSYTPGGPLDLSEIKDRKKNAGSQVKQPKSSSFQKRLETSLQMPNFSTETETSNKTEAQHHQAQKQERSHNVHPNIQQTTTFQPSYSQPFQKPTTPPAGTSFSPQSSYQHAQTRDVYQAVQSPGAASPARSIGSPVKTTTYISPQPSYTPVMEEDESECPEYRNVSNPKKQSLSFKVLQWMTDTEDTIEENSSAPTISQKDPRDIRKELRRKESFNAEDDEMHFSGIHGGSNPVMPSRSFNILQRMTSQDKDFYQPASPVVQTSNIEPAPVPNKVQLQPSDVTDIGNYNETSIRYKGRNIPSRSFKMLQEMTDPLDDPYPPNTPTQIYNQPTTSPTLEVTDIGNYDQTSIRYKGRNIPSRSFKMLKEYTDPLVQTYIPIDVEPTNTNEIQDIGNYDETSIRYRGRNNPSRSFKLLQERTGMTTGIEVPKPIAVRHQISREAGLSDF